MIKNINKILNIALIITIFSLILSIAYIQVSRPELFIIEVADSSAIPDYSIESLYYNESMPPYLDCKIINYAQECRYVNIPRDKPYVTRTNWAFLYENQQLLILLITILGVILNWERLKEWKNKIQSQQK